MIQQVVPVPVYAQQAEFLASQKWCTGFVGGRGSGKSRIGAHWVCKKAKNEDPWLAVSPDAGVVTETTLPTFLEVSQSLGIYLRHKLSPYPKVWFRTQDGGTAEIIFRSGEKPKKLHGPNKAGLWIDEASLQHYDVFQDAIPTLRWRGDMGPVLLTFTPKGKANWTFTTFFDPVEDDGDDDDPGITLIGGKAYRAKENTKLVHATSRDNPFLPPEFYSVLRSNMSQLLAEQELEGNFVEVAGLMFSRAWFPFVDEAPRDALRVRYWDRASTPGGGSFTAGALLARCPRGMTYIEDIVRGQWSYHERDLIIEQTAEADARKYRGEVVIIAEQEGGSGGKEVMHQMMTKLGRFPVQRDIVGGKQLRFENGVTLPGQAKITRAMPLSGQAEAGNVYVVRGKWNSDLLDELCIAIGSLVTTFRGQVAIEHVVPGDLVWTREGWRKVIHSRMTARSSRVLFLKTKSGLSLLATENHPVWVNSKGFTRMSHLRVGDELLRLSTDNDSIFTRNPKLSQRDCISLDSWMENTLSFTDGFTSNESVKSISQFISIIETETLETIASKTWRHCQGAIISCTTSNAEMFSSPRNCMMQSVLSVESHSKQFSQLGQEPADLRADGEINSFREMTLSTKENARYAESPIDPERRMGDSVHRLAQALGQQIKNDCQKNHARFVESCISQYQAGPSAVADRVEFVSDMRIDSDVFNLEVEGKPEYFANGILTHNCAFPESKIADQVDAVSGAYNRLAGKIFAPREAATKEKELPNTSDRFGALAALQNFKRGQHRLFGLESRGSRRR